MAPNYYVRSENGTIVETWSVQVLPFEPKDWRREWRDELKRKLLDLSPSGDAGFLAARYESAVRDHARDAENILFYNVGGAFATSTRGGLRFERLYSATPLAPVELSGPALHYHHYELAEPRALFRGWRETNLLAEFRDIGVPRLRFDSKPSPVWLPLRQAGVEITRTAQAPAPFALRLRVKTPPDAGVAASFVKPLFDGAVATFQAHDGWRVAEIAAWMESRFSSTFPGLTAGQVAKLLDDDSMAALGGSRLFRQFRDGFMFAPEDDRCVAGELEISRVPGLKGFNLSGALYEVEPAPAYDASSEPPPAVVR